MGLLLVEIEYWTQRRLGTGAWLAFLDDVAAGAFRVEDLVAADYRRVRERCDRNVDALTLVPLDQA